MTGSPASTREVALAGLGFAAAVTATAWPLPAHLGSALPDPAAGGDPLGVWNRLDLDLVIWILTTVARGLRDHPLTLFDARMFHPAPDLLAGSENLLGLAPISAPIYWLTGNPVLTYNVTVLVVVWLTAVGTYATVRAWTESRLAALVAGTALGLCPYLVAGWARLHWSAISLFPIVLLLTDRAARDPSPRRLAVLSAVTAVQILAGVYVAFELAALLACFVPVVLWIHRNRAWWKVVGALVVSALPSVPLALAYERYARTTAHHGLEEALELLRAFAMPITATGALVVRQLTLPVVVLAAIGASGTRGLERPARLALLLAAGLGFLLALGPDTSLLPWTDLPGIYRVAMDVVPGFDQIRGPARFLAVPFVALAVLAGLGAADLARIAQGRIAGRAVAAGLAALVAFLVLHRLPESGVALAEADPEGRPVDRWLREHGNDDVVMEIPTGGSALQFQRLLATGEYLRGAAVHGQRLVNGYTGHPPRSHRLISTIARGLPEPDALADLCALTGVKYLVVHYDKLGPDRARWSGVGQRLPLRAVAKQEAAWVFQVESPCGNLAPALRRELATDAPAFSLGGVSLDQVAEADRRAVVRADLEGPFLAGLARPQRFEITNLGKRAWPGLTAAENGGVEVLVRWEDRESGRQWEQPSSTPLATDLAPGETARVWVDLQHPSIGAYRLEVGVGQRGEWLSPPGDEAGRFITEIETVPPKPARSR